MKIAALGRTHWLLDSIKLCMECGHEIVLIGTCPAAPEYAVQENSFAYLAGAVGCPYFCDANLNQRKYLEIIDKGKADVAISVNWLGIMPGEVLRSFKHGIINAHTGDLPQYRGNAAPNWAIINGEEKVAVTLHKMASVLDAGPILLQKKFKLNDDTYIGDIYRFMDANIPGMFVEAVAGLEKGTLQPWEQSAELTQSLRGFPRLPRDGELDWQLPAKYLCRLVRASAEPFAGAYSFFDGQKINIWRAHVGQLLYPYLGVPGQVVERNVETGEVAIVCGDGILVLEEVETSLAGRGRASDILRSMRIRLGMDVSGEISELKKRINEIESIIKGNG